SALAAKWIGDRCLKTEHRHRAKRRQHQLRHRLARRRSDLELSFRRCRAAEGVGEALDEALEVVWCHINVRGVVLRANRDILSEGSAEAAEQSQQRDRNNPDHEDTPFCRWARIAAKAKPPMRPRCSKKPLSAIKRACPCRVQKLLATSMAIAVSTES